MRRAWWEFGISSALLGQTLTSAHGTRTDSGCFFSQELEMSCRSYDQPTLVPCRHPQTSPFP